jgi:CRISPR-associated protein Cmr6
MFRGLNLVAQSLGIEMEAQERNNSSGGHADFTPDEIPMIYRAQIDGRCSLQFAGKNQDLEDWRNEWVAPNKIDAKPKQGKGKGDFQSSDLNQPRHQRSQPLLGIVGNTYRIEVKFPFRLISNCGQDSIIRPIMGKDGIPFLSGSSVKGAFRRACNLEQIKKYCGFEDKSDKGHSPSTSGLRFHGAYPVGDWSGSHEVKVRHGDRLEDVTRYRMIDVVHPQQERQVGIPTNRNATAIASVSLRNPTMIFEFSGAAITEDDWKEVERIFWDAIASGIGGKTSTGYGLGGYNDSHPAIVAKHKFDVALTGQGVSSTLRSDEPEFRPNLFKASLRGHVQRLLGGVTNNADHITKEVERLFGSSNDVGALKIFWKQQEQVTYGDYGQTKTFKAKGILHIDANKQDDVDFVEQVFKFAFVMGGFGKSWRRVSHEIFHSSYKKFEIGCHWQLPSIGDLNWLGIKSSQDLKQFLNELPDMCKKRLSIPAGHQSWREAWHRDRVTVYAKETEKSSVVELFHRDIFKRTEAIGGHITVIKKDRETGKEKKSEQLVFSHVWHRMLPIDDDRYLEIVTVFHRDRNKWKHKKDQNDQDGEDQLQPFLDAITNNGLVYVWGNQNPSKTPPRNTLPSPKPSKSESQFSNKPILKHQPPQT